jgi:hypothetical protein
MKVISYTGDSLFANMYIYAYMYMVQQNLKHSIPLNVQEEKGCQAITVKLLKLQFSGLILCTNLDQF